MRAIVDGAVVRRLAGQSPNGLTGPGAFQVVRQLGGLAPWWLTEEVLRCAGEHCPAQMVYARRPTLPVSPGSCWIAIALQRQAGLFRPAVLLPLCWRAKTEHAAQLPIPLRELAERVVRQLGASGWGLHLHEDAGLAGVDLGGLTGEDLSAKSGWATLVGGLVLARQERLPRADVWASAAWHPTFGIGPVKGLAAKQPRGPGHRTLRPLAARVRKQCQLLLDLDFPRAS